MASVADWIETTLGTVPGDQDTIAAYWVTEEEYIGGAAVELTPDQLFSYWSDSGIGGMRLTADAGLDRRDPRRGQSVGPVCPHGGGEPP